MCASCGCGKPNDKHGDDRNITMQEIERAAQASNISPEQAAQNIVDCCQQMQGSSQQGQQRQAGRM